MVDGEGTKVTIAVQRLIELTEDRLLAAQDLGLSVAGKIARIYALIETDELSEACDLLDELDALINTAKAEIEENGI